jgi:hypothetical protein
MVEAVELVVAEVVVMEVFSILEAEEVEVEVLTALQR